MLISIKFISYKAVLNFFIIFSNEISSSSMHPGQQRLIFTRANIKIGINLNISEKIM